ncbi:radical SAM protein [bacterium D16-50]|nr:radical SAM protein [bacterium D16-50]
MEYGFYDRLRENMPSQIIIDIDQNCNYACVHCPHGKFRKSDIYTGARLSEELNRKLVDEVREAGNGDVQHLRYTANGEPLLHPHAVEILTYAAQNSGTFVSLTTNGSLLTKEVSRQLLLSGIGLIDISLDAYHEDTYALIRKNGNLVRVRQNVLDLLQLRRETNAQTKIVVSYVIQPDNINEIEDFEKYWMQQGVYQVVFRKLHTAGGSIKNSSVETDSGEYQPCVYPWERLSIGPDGEFEFCPASWEGKMHLGFNIKDHTIYEVWHSDRYRKLREEHLRAAFADFKICGECPDRNHIIWPGKDGRKAYGDMIKELKK